MQPSAPTGRIPAALRAWFVLDLVLALFPPLHWWAGTPEPVLGVPRVLAYLFGTGLVIALSAVALHRHHADRAGEAA